jgi:hypothetical protein
MRSATKFCRNLVICLWRFLADREKAPHPTSGLGSKNAKSGCITMQKGCTAYRPDLATTEKSAYRDVAHVLAKNL